jgi:hypothetical protein
MEKNMSRKAQKASAETERGRGPGLAGDIGFEGVPASEAEAKRLECERRAFELYALTKAVNDWPAIYDGVLEKTRMVRDEKAKIEIARELVKWEDQHIPRLLDIRSRHFQELAATRESETVLKREFLIRNLASNEERLALIHELCPVMVDLFALDKTLDKVIACQGGRQAATAKPEAS